MREKEVRTKTHVLRAFLEFVSRYLPLSEATLATLGGEGLEAGLWQEMGIAGDRGWLVEQNRRRMRQLMAAQFPFRFTTELDRFPDVLHAVHGKDASVDALHLDLCGTVEATRHRFGPLVSLVTGSRGQCLAVTVLDARKNLSLVNWDVVLRRGRVLLGRTGTAAFLARLKREQVQVPKPRFNAPYLKHADPRKGVRREFGFLLHLLTLLVGPRGVVANLPDRVERYIYVSRWSGYPFRMRTYFFHFARAGSITVKAAARILTSRWCEHPLRYLRDGTMVTITPEATREPQQPKRREAMKKSSTENWIALRALAAAAGGEHLAQFEDLVRRAEGSVGLEHQIDRLTGDLAMRDNLLRTVREALDGAALAEKPRKEATRPNGRTDQGAMSAPATNGNRFAVQFDLLRAAARKELEKAYEAAARTLGVKSKKNWRNIVGATFARTQGGFRGDFILRATKELPKSARESLLGELANIYSAIMGQKVTVAELEAEVVAAERQARKMARKRAGFLAQARQAKRQKAE